MARWLCLIVLGCVIILLPAIDCHYNSLQFVSHLDAPHFDTNTATKWSPPAPVTSNLTRKLTEKEKIAVYMSEIYAYLLPKLWQWVMIVCYVFVFVVGLLGNVLVCVVVARNCAMHTVTNYFIVNLAVADLLVLLFCLPPSLLWDITSTWFFGRYMCKMFLYIQTVSVSVSVLTLTVIAIDRWYAICYPLRFKSTTRKAQTAMAIIWMIACVLDIPELIVYETIPFEHEYNVETIFFTQCAPSWDAHIEQKWIIFRILMLYVLPLMLMSVFYVQIVRVLWQSQTVDYHPTYNHRDVGVCETRPFNFSMVSNTSTKGQLRTRKKCARMLVSVVTIFAVCYFPVHLLSLLRLVTRLSNNDSNQAFAMVSHWLCYANSAVNPIIYNFMSGKFRKEFRRAMKCRTRPQLARIEMNNLQKTATNRTNSGCSLGRSDNKTTATST